MQTFETGATRDNDDSKYDYEAFFSPLVLERRAQYMHSHRVQKDGKPRDGDNWQKGIPLPKYLKSLQRHLVDVWLIHRGYRVLGREGENLEDLLCAIMFNAEGYLHETLKAKLAKPDLPPALQVDLARISESTHKRGTEDEESVFLGVARG